MPRSKPRSLLLKDPAAIAVVGSPHRLEILSSLSEAGPASVAELSDRLGRSPHSLYFHLGKLEQIGLVRVHETRVVRGQVEKTWRTVAERILLGSSRLPGSASAAGHAADAMLRLTSRELRRALEHAEGSDGEEERGVIGVRMKGRIDRKSLARIRALIEEIESIVRGGKARRRGPMHAVTVVVTPTPDARGNEK